MEAFDVDETDRIEELRMRELSVGGLGEVRV